MLNFVMCDDNLNALNKLSHMFESVFMKYDLKAQIAFKTTNEHELLSNVKGLIFQVSFEKHRITPI